MTSKGDKILNDKGFLCPTGLMSAPKRRISATICLCKEDDVLYKGDV